MARYLAMLGARDIDDEAQEVFFRAHKLGGFIPGAAHPRSWLYQIATHVRSERRRGTRRRPTDFDEEAIDSALDAAPSPEDDTATREGLTCLQRALDTLSDEQRETVVLYELEELSCEAIAQILEIPIGTVYSRLNTARKILHEFYRRWGAEAPQKSDSAPPRDRSVAPKDRRLDTLHSHSGTFQSQGGPLKSRARL